MKEINIFISYSKDDYDYMQIIDGLCRQMEYIDYDDEKFGIRIYSDQYIVAGEAWKQKILDYIDDADLVLFVLSKKFNSSDFIQTVEIPRVMNRRAETAIGVLGIYLEECNYREYELRKTQLTPQYKGRLIPLISWENKIEGLDAIQKSIEMCSYLSIDRNPALTGKPPKGELPRDILMKNYSYKAPEPVQQLKEWATQKAVEEIKFPTPAGNSIARQVTIDNENNRIIVEDTVEVADNPLPWMIIILVGIIIAIILYISLK